MQTNSRRGFLRGGVAALAGATAPAAALASSAAAGTTAHDPVFSLLRDERKAWLAFEAAIDRFTQAESAVCDCPDNDPRYAALEEAERQAIEAESHASDAATQLRLEACRSATTPAGFLAAFERFMQRERAMISDPLDGMLDGLLDTARALFGSSQGRP
jgi:hypothetical protein